MHINEAEHNTGVRLHGPPDARVHDDPGPLVPAELAVCLAAQADRLLELPLDLILPLVLLLLIVHQKPAHPFYVKLSKSKYYQYCNWLMFVMISNIIYTALLVCQRGETMTNCRRHLQQPRTSGHTSTSPNNLHTYMYLLILPNLLDKVYRYFLLMPSLNN